MKKVIVAALSLFSLNACIGSLPQEDFRSVNELTLSVNSLTPFPIDYEIIVATEAELLESLVGESLVDIDNFFRTVALPRAEDTWIDTFWDSADFRDVIRGHRGTLDLFSDYLVNEFSELEYYTGDARLNNFEANPGSSRVDGTFTYSSVFDIYYQSLDHEAMNLDYLLYDGEYVLAVAFTYQNDFYSGQAVVQSGENLYFCDFNRFQEFTCSDF